MTDKVGVGRMSYNLPSGSHSEKSTPSKMGSRNSAEKRYEEYAYVLDYLPHGRPRARKRRIGATVVLLGDKEFTLLEAEVKPGVTLRPQDRIFIGKGDRSEITRIIGRLGYEELSAAAKDELETAIRSVLLSRERQYVDFFNTAQAVTPRMSGLEILRGIGKKYAMQIMKEREKKPFESFEDLQRRTGIPDPVLLLTKRIIEELSDRDIKYRRFVRA